MSKALLLAVVALFATQANAELDAGVAASSTDALAKTLYFGQYYPSGAIYLVPMVDAEVREPPSSVHYVFVANGVEGGSGQAAFVRAVSDEHPPTLESMPSEDRCKEAVHPDSGFRYLAIAEFDATIDFQDFFDRGVPDNCEDEGLILKYQSDRKAAISVPVVAMSSGTGFLVSTTLTGTSRVPTDPERAEIARYRAEYIRDYRSAFDNDFGSDGSTASDIPTLADATVLFDVELPGQPHHLRISQWSRVSIAQHLYRVMVVDEMDGDVVTNTVQHETAQGSL